MYFICHHTLWGHYRLLFTQLSIIQAVCAMFAVNQVELSKGSLDHKKGCGESDTENIISNAVRLTCTPLQLTEHLQGL